MGRGQGAAPFIYNNLNTLAEMIDPIESQDDPREEERDQMPKMTLGQHLDELRVRLMIAGAAMILAALTFLFMGSFPLRIAMRPYHQAWGWLAQDWMEKLAEDKKAGKLDKSGKEAYEWIFGRIEKPGLEPLGGSKEEILSGSVKDGVLAAHGFDYKRNLALLGPIEYVVAWMKVALIFGLVIASPIVFHQMWRFIAAGLYKTERHKVMKFLPFTVGLFMAGASFAYFLMIPMALYFLASIADPSLFGQNYTAKEYIGFFFTVTVAMGMVFQLPVIMVGVASMGIMSSESMRKKRKIFILCAFVLGAFLTPPDPFTQVFMATPLLLLFEIGLILSAAIERRKKAAMEGGAP